MNHDAVLAIQIELDSGEKLLWADQPIQGVKLRGIDALLIPFSFLWGSIAISWEYSVLQTGAPFFFTLFGIPFVLAGAYIMFGRFFIEAKRREKTFYGLSNERIIIVSGLFSKSVKSLNLKALSDVSLSESNNDYGSISFGNSSPFSLIFSGTSWPGMKKFVGPMFDLIPNAKQVYNQVRTAQKNAI